MRNSDQNFALDNQLCFALYSASLSMSKVYKPYLDAVGLTYPQYLVMLVLWETDHQTVSAIGERLFLDSGTLTPLLKRLETSAYLKRMRDTNDERRVVVSLTTLGKNLKRKITPLPSKMLEATRCTHKEAMQLAQDLKDLRTHLKQSEER